MKTPDEAESRLIEALQHLRSAAYTSFTDRREYEWKFCIATWTALAIFVSSLVLKPIASGNYYGISVGILTGLTAVLSVLLCLVHYKWLEGIAKGNAIDQRLEIEVKEHIRSVLKIEWSKGLQKRIDERGKEDESAPPLKWGHKIELSITIMLCSTAFIVCLFQLSQVYFS
jgi:hypothetical protein